MTRTIRHPALAPAAFTLVELLVVVAIIALLIAILLPSLMRAKRTAMRVRCAANLHELCTLDLMYASDNNDAIPRNIDVNTSSVYNLLARMQGIPLVAGTANGGYESQFRDSYAKIKWLNCPAFPKTNQAVCFVVNGFDPNNNGSEPPYVKLPQIRRPVENCNFTDANMNIPPDDFQVYDLWQATHLQPNASTTVTPGSSVGRILSDDRHSGMINMGYYDAHVDCKPYGKVVIADFVN